MNGCVGVSTDVIDSDPETSTSMYSYSKLASNTSILFITSQTTCLFDGIRFLPEREVISFNVVEDGVGGVSAKAKLMDRRAIEINVK